MAADAADAADAAGATGATNTAPAADDGRGPDGYRGIPGAPGRPAAPIERPPRRVRHGLRLRGREEPRVSSELATRWLDRVSAGVTDAEEATEGLKYARVGQTTTLDIAAGGVTARVQGHRGRPYAVRIPVPAWPLETRDAVVAALAGEAASLAALLDRRLPEGLDEMLAGLDLELVPPVLEPTCECRRPRTCRHVAAVGMLVAERLEDDPVLVLAMRDLPADRLLDRLRQQRALESRGLVTAHPEPDVPEAREEPPPLAEGAATFWRPAARRTELAAGLPRDEQDHALLRRLGSSPLGGQFPLVGLLASIYDAVRDEVRRGEAAAEAWSGRAEDEEEGLGGLADLSGAAGSTAAGAEPPEEAEAVPAAAGGDVASREPLEASPAAAPAKARAMPKARAKPGRARAKAKARPRDGGGGGSGA